MAVFLADIEHSISATSYPHRYYGPSDHRLIVVAPTEIIQVYVLHGGLHRLQSERPVAVVDIYDVVVVVVETLEDDVLKPLV